MYSLWLCTNSPAFQMCHQGLRMPRKRADTSPTLLALYSWRQGQPHPGIQ
eukprot:jgi/Botrbrau1/17100/Bobra.0157s0005.1